MKHSRISEYGPLALLILALAIAVGVLFSGCASSDRGARDLTRIERKQTQVVIPASADAPARIVPVLEITETREGETSLRSGTSGPDWQQIQPVMQVIGAAAGGGSGLGTVLGVVATAIPALLAGWASQRPQIKDQRERLERLRVDRDESRAQVEELSRQLPPTTASEA